MTIGRYYDYPYTLYVYIEGTLSTSSKAYVRFPVASKVEGIFAEVEDDGTSGTTKVRLIAPDSGTVSDDVAIVAGAANAYHNVTAIDDEDVTAGYGFVEVFEIPGTASNTLRCTIYCRGVADA